MEIENKEAVFVYFCVGKLERSFGADVVMAAENGRKDHEAVVFALFFASNFESVRAAFGGTLDAHCRVSVVVKQDDALGFA